MWNYQEQIEQLRQENCWLAGRAIAYIAIFFVAGFIAGLLCRFGN
jgi:hypothetical protein